MTTLEPHGTDVQISGLVTGLPEHIEAASSATLSAHMALTDLARLNDIDLFDGQDGHDALAELTEAMRHLRNARRIAERRLELLTEDDAGEQLARLTQQREVALALAAEAFTNSGADIQEGGRSTGAAAVDAHDLVSALGGNGAESARSGGTGRPRPMPAAWPNR